MSFPHFSAFTARLTKTSSYYDMYEGNPNSYPDVDVEEDWDDTPEPLRWNEFADIDGGRRAKLVTQQRFASVPTVRTRRGPDGRVIERERAITYQPVDKEGIVSILSTRERSPEEIARLESDARGENALFGGLLGSIGGGYLGLLGGAASAAHPRIPPSVAPGLGIGVGLAGLGLGALAGSRWGRSWNVNVDPTVHLEDVVYEGPENEARLRWLDLQKTSAQDDDFSGFGAGLGTLGGAAAGGYLLDANRMKGVRTYVGRGSRLLQGWGQNAGNTRTGALARNAGKMGRAFARTGFGGPVGRLVAGGLIGGLAGRTVGGIAGGLVPRGQQPQQPQQGYYGP